MMRQTTDDNPTEDPAENEEAPEIDPRDDIIRRLNAALSRPIDELLVEDEQERAA